VAIKLRPVRPAGWWFDFLLLAALAAMTGALSAGALLDLDLAVRDWVDGHRPAWAYWTARTANLLGQGGAVLVPLSILLAGPLARRTRSVRPLVLVAATFLLTYVTIGPPKLVFQRGYPHNQELAHPERLFSDPVGGTAYPSGHVANAIVWFGVITMLVAALVRAYGRGPLDRRVALALRVVPPVVVFLATTYLGFHWLTDAVAGVLLGLVLDRLVHRIPWDDVPLPARLGDWRRPAFTGAG
jgi:membrane-associated phospholipid phosphatase